MSTVRYFRWDDPGAPSLTGEVGSLTNLLRKCLVGTAGVAYGSKASAGWSEQFTGTASNIAAFRNSTAAGGSGCYVLVNDNGPGAAGARESRITAYAAMTDINTGTQPTTTHYFRKSSALSSAARPWVVVVDELTAWLFVHTNGDAATFAQNTSFAGFGDYDPLVSTSYRYFTLGRTTENQSSGGACPVFDITAAQYTTVTARGLSVFPQSGTGSAIQAAICHPVYSSNSTAIGGQFAPAGPHSISGDYIFEKNPRIRVASNFEMLGRLRGIKLPCHSIYTSTVGAAFSVDANSVVVAVATGNLATTNNAGYLTLDTVGPW